MEYVYASLLLHYAKRPITEDSLRKVLEAAGIEVDDVRVKAVVAALSSVNIDEAIKSASMAVPVAATAAQPVQPAAQAAAAPKEEAETKKEEEEKPSEEEAVEGLAALFG
jgi:large subunit ribosomal protein L12